MFLEVFIMNNECFKDLMEKANNLKLRITATCNKTNTYVLNLNMITDTPTFNEESLDYTGKYWTEVSSHSNSILYSISGTLDKKQIKYKNLDKITLVRTLRKLVMFHEAQSKYKDFDWSFIQSLVLPDVSEKLYLVDLNPYKDDVRNDVDIHSVWGSLPDNDEVYALLTQLPNVLKYGLIIIQDGMDPDCYLHPLDKQDLLSLKGLVWDTESDTKQFDNWIDQIVEKVPDIDTSLLTDMPVEVTACVPDDDSKAIVKQN